MLAILIRGAAAAAASLAATAGLASQGPGVGAGTASPLQQGIVTLIIAGLGSIVVVGLVAMLLGARPPD